MEAQVLGVLEQKEAPHCWAEQVSEEVVEVAEAGEGRHLEAAEEAEVVVAQHSQGVVGVLVAKVQVQVGGEEEGGWRPEGVGLEGEARASPDSMRRLPQPEAEAVHGCLCCHSGERAGLKRRYSAFWVLSGYFWLSCHHLRRA